ncbi:MAG: SDR family oxidoreductase [Chitinophagales bacterium]
MQDYFKGKTIVISGVARGIGKALALEAASYGMQVVGLDLRKEELEELSAELLAKSAEFYLEAVDIREEKACVLFIEKALSRFGSIDMLINNAGITHIAPESKTELRHTKNVMDVNFMGTVHLSHLCLPEIIKNKGTIAGVSSVAGYSPLVYRTAYAASKHAVWGYFSSLRAELRAKGVQVLTICPSFVSTDLQEEQKAYFKNNTSEALSPAYVSEEIYKAIHQKKDVVLIGKTARRVYFLNRFFPKLYEKIMLKKMF